MHLPDRKRPSLSQPARVLAASVVHLATHAAWRTLNPAKRERFTEASEPTPVRRLYYTARDGWSSPLFALPVRPGATAEPVLLAHTLGIGGDAFRYGEQATLAHALVDAGFAVYLFTHRGDRDAIAPETRVPTDLDAIVGQDLPAAIQAVRDDTGAAQLHFVGHGIGGWVGLWGAAAGMQLASVSTLAAPAVFPRFGSEARRVQLLARLLPSGARLPLAELARVGLPWLDPERLGLATTGPRLRGAVSVSAESVSADLAAQILRWVVEGRPSSRGGVVDGLEVLRDARVPLLAVTGERSRTCGADSLSAVVQHWGDEDRQQWTAPGCSGLDLALSARAADSVFPKLVGWLSERRGRAWGLHEPTLCSELAP